MDIKNVKQTVQEIVSLSNDDPEMAHEKEDDLYSKQYEDAQVAMAKVFRATALSTAKRRDEEVMRKCQEPRLVEKRKQAKKDFNEFIRSH